LAQDLDRLFQASSGRYEQISGNGIVPTIVTAPRGVTNARFFETERAYLGELLADLRLALLGLALDGDPDRRAGTTVSLCRA
jgi:hypothetical protein